MYDDILAEMEARGMFKEAKESKQNPWRDGVLGAGGAVAGAGAGGYAGLSVASRRAKPGIEAAAKKLEAGQASMRRGSKVRKRIRPGSLLDHAFGGTRSTQKGRKLVGEAGAEAAQGLVNIAKGGGRGLAAGAVLGGLTGVAASRLMGREKKASSQDEIEQMLLFAAFENELEKISGRGRRLRQVLFNRADDARRVKVPSGGSGSGGLLSRNVSTHTEDVAGGGKWVATPLGRTFVRPRGAAPAIKPSGR